MRMLRLIVASLALFSLGKSSLAGETIALRVLYAGNPGSDREGDFKRFLNEHFAEVGTIDYRKFKENDSSGYDVVVFDWTSIYPRDKDGKIEQNYTALNLPTPPELTQNYDRPTILIGAAGESVARPLQLKLDWR